MSGVLMLAVLSVNTMFLISTIVGWVAALLWYAYLRHICDGKGPSAGSYGFIMMVIGCPLCFLVAQWLSILVMFGR